jgi:hypothetical protein
MNIDDFIDVMVVDVGVPGALRVNYEDRTFFATIQTAGLIDADLAAAAEAQFLDARFQVLLRRVRTFIGATCAAVGALIHANE